MEGVEISKYAVDTPALLLDIEKFERNVAAMQKHALANGKHLRPHAKTHKCSEIAKRQLASGAIGICVAKVSEAAVLVEKGVRKGVLITSPVVTKAKIATLIKVLTSTTTTTSTSTTATTLVTRTSGGHHGGRR